jgi:hypothetical protein
MTASGSAFESSCLVYFLFSMRLLSLLICVFGFSAGWAQQRDGGEGVYAGDPTLFYDGGHYYVFSSGERGPFWVSEDLYTWRSGGELFEKMPEWALKVVPEQGRKHYVWAPDICKVDGEYRAYWSTSMPGSRRSVIGLMVNVRPEVAALPLGGPGDDHPHAGEQ